MRTLLVGSLDDPASVNIRERLFEMCIWEEVDAPLPTWRCSAFEMVFIRGEKIYAEGLDTRLRDMGYVFDRMVFISRHRSASGIPTLTVHPVGNWGRAEAGGKDETLAPPAPHDMTAALRALRCQARDLDYHVSFEATHHGPYLETPTYFIEIGSGPEQWADAGAARAIAEALMTARPINAPVIIGVGGGHYMPRLTDLALERRVSVGHMLPAYAVKYVKAEILIEAAEMSDTSLVYVHRKGLKGDDRRRALEIIKDAGLEVVTSDAFEPLDAH